MTSKLADGRYPFIDERLPLSELAMIEMPADMEDLLREQARKSNTEIVRGELIELRCVTEQFGDAVFLVYWPEEEGRLHMLAPRRFCQGLA